MEEAVWDDDDALLADDDKVASTVENGLIILLRPPNNSLIRPVDDVLQVIKYDELSYVQPNLPVGDP